MSVEGKRLYRVHEDELIAHPRELPPGFSSNGLALVGRYPDKLFAFELSGVAPALTTFQWTTNAGWNETPLPAYPLWRVAWWSGQLIGFASDPSRQALGQFPIRLIGDVNPALVIPQGQGPACDKLAAASFPKLVVQSRDLYAVGSELFVVGYGCDGNVAAVSWSGERGNASADTNANAKPLVPMVHAIPQRTFMDDRYGGMLKGEGKTRWLWMPAMRPSRERAVLWRWDGSSTWMQRPFPREASSNGDPIQVDVDENGSLWVVVRAMSEQTQTHLLFREEGDQWIETPLPRGCDLPNISLAEKRSVWVACKDHVARMDR